MKRRDFLTFCIAVGLLPTLPQTVYGEDPTPIGFKELYGKRMVFSDKTLALDGQPVIIEGYMAPPLKPDVDFFIMTRRPLAVCPFCDNEADWPADILFIRMSGRQGFVKFNRRIRVVGRLEIGTDKDRETGFVSRIRITDAVYEIV